MYLKKYQIKVTKGGGKTLLAVESTREYQYQFV
jgi:hypothetical protein